MKDNIYFGARDLITIEIGLMISSMGTALFYAGERGSAPMATFCDGIHRTFSVSYGTANIVVNIALLGVLFVLNRQYIALGTALCVFTIGPWVNFFGFVFSALGVSGAFLPAGLLLSFCGTVLMGTGLGLYMAVDRGLGALEGIVKHLCVNKGIPTSMAKIIQDTLLVLGGIVLKATWGIGTFVAVILTGPIMHFSALFFGRILAGRSAGSAP
jgi:uncharacterized membrane protein YczE